MARNDIQVMSTIRAGLSGLSTLPEAIQKWHRTMNHVAWLLLMVTFLQAGCTTLQPMASNAETLRNELRSGDIVRPGDKVRVVSRDGLSRLLIVVAVDQNFIKGHPEGVETEYAVITIPIDDIVFMEGMKVSVGKTAAYSGGVSVGAAIALVIGAIIFLLTHPLF